MRRVLLLCAVLSTAAVLSGCGSGDETDRDEVLEFIEATRADVSGFVYTEIVGDREVEVRGVIDDDFRYEARVAVDGRPVFDEVVLDDALADRVLDPIALEEFYAPSGLGRSGDDADEGISVADAFSSRRWVLDDDGAPDLLGVSDVGEDQGKDPIHDALTVLDYLENTVLRQSFIVKFRPNDINYSPQDDPFPTPQKGSGIDRYDVRPPPLPSATDSANVNQAIPSTFHFRKMAVYVKDGKIVQILEDIDVIGRLDEIERKYDLDLTGLSAQEAADLAIQAINAVRRGQGENPIRVRRMSAGFTDESAEVTLPTENVVKGELGALLNRGREIDPDDDSSGSPAAGDSAPADTPAEAPPPSEPPEPAGP